MPLTLTSPKSGQPPIDPKSDLPENQTPTMARFKRDKQAQEVLAHTVRLADMKSDDHDAVFYIGRQPVAAVCHSPAVFHRATYDGQPLS